MARILVVDDQPDARTLLAKHLRKWGHEVVEAADGNAGLEEIRRGDVDLAFVDARMPGLDGFEVCERAKEHLKAHAGDRFLPIIMVTALDERESKNALQKGADDYITKPFDPEILKARLDVQLRTLGLHRNLEETSRVLREQREQLERLTERLQALATTDGLTGLLNHRRLQERLHGKDDEEDGEAARALRQGTALAALMVDIDHFKSLNDARGHLFGDRVLQHVAGTIRHSLRGIDILGRYGGEEFAALLIEATKAEALEAGERVRAAVAATPFAPEGYEPARLTVSVGVATFPEDIDDPNRLLALADMALYAAKRGGRNRVERLARHRFQYAPGPSEETAAVAVGGDFNGWSRTAHPLRLDDDGVWRLETTVPTGRLRYKFYVNGERWIPDPAAKIVEEDSLKEPVSVVVIR